MQCFISWMEDWEKDSGTAARDMFVNKYNVTTFYFPDTNEICHVYDHGFNFCAAIVGDGTSMEILTSQE